MTTKDNHRSGALQKAAQRLERVAEVVRTEIGRRGRGDKSTQPQLLKPQAEGQHPEVERFARDLADAAAGVASFPLAFLVRQVEVILGMVARVAERVDGLRHEVAELRRSVAAVRQQEPVHPAAPFR